MIQDSILALQIFRAIKGFYYKYKNTKDTDDYWQAVISDIKVINDRYEGTEWEAFIRSSLLGILDILEQREKNKRERGNKNMMEINIKITGLDNLASAIDHLASAIEGKNEPVNPGRDTATEASAMASQASAVPQMPTAIQTPAVPIGQTMAVPQTAGIVSAAAPQVSMSGSPATAVPVSTTPTGYTMEQLAVAATGLVDAGKGDAIRDILAGFGVQALTQLTKEQYGAFAMKLREAGASI